MARKAAKPKIEEAGLSTWRRALGNMKRIHELEKLAQVQQETIVVLAKSIEGVQKTVTSTVALVATMAKRINEISDRNTGPGPEGE